jgi:hypothetical protein
MPRSISWSRTLGEGAVIVGSILMAFALDAWWDGISRSRELQAQLEVVADELQSTRSGLAMVQRAHDLNVQLARKLRLQLEAADPGTSIEVSEDDVGPLLPQVTADVTTRALEAFIASGGLEVIQNLDLRAELLAWPARIEDLLDDEIYLRNFAAADLVRWLRSNTGVANAERLSLSMVLGRFGAGSPPAPSEVKTLSLPHRRELINLLAARESGDAGISRNIDQLLEMADRHIDAITTPH